jgi:pimeloyl-ACP methyl ester carboxylesterase
MTDTPLIYTNPEGKAKCLAIYETGLAHWPVPYDQLDLPTRFGSTHVIVSGPKTAPPLVLLHGQWASSMMWSSVIGELSQGYRTYAIDQIDDIGKSVPARLPASRSDYATWLLDVLDQLDLPQVDLVGLSYGGFLAVNFALSAPGRVKRLILLCPGVPSFGPPTFKWAIHGLPMTLFPSRLTARWLIQGMSVKGDLSHSLEAEQIMAGVMNLRSRIPFRPVFSDNEFGNLKMAVLLLIGDKEAMVDPKAAAARARQLIPHIETTLISNAGHMLNTDQPEVMLGRILRFLHPSLPSNA